MMHGFKDFQMPQQINIGKYCESNLPEAEYETKQIFRKNKAVDQRK